MILCLKLIAFGEVIVQFYHEECEVLKFVRWETTFMAKRWRLNTDVECSHLKCTVAKC
jgi:hypothetical protein